MSKALATKNVAAVLLALSLALGVSLAFVGSAKAQTTSSNSSTLSSLQAQVQALLAQIASLQGTGSSSSSSGGACFTFTKTLSLGSRGAEVMQLQKFINGVPGGQDVAASGPGSVGNETTYFGPGTKKAVIAFQKAQGISPASGLWGPMTRAKANSMCSTGSTSGGTTGGTTTPTGPGITVTAGSQPANSLAPTSAVRVPFTTFTVTNNSGAAVTINGITVQRTGLAADAAFANVVLVDSNGLQVGNTQTFDSNHNATVGGTITLQAGASMTYTVAGNMGSVQANYAGQVASISVTGVNTSVPVTGTLPITGAQQTINSSLTIGTVTTQISSLDPNSATNKPIGSTGVKFTAVRFTAGSAEDLKLYSMRWRINGSASVSDLANLVTVVNGTSYPATVSADGRYVTSTFPGGVLVSKGNSVDVYIQGDLTGSNSAGRVVEFDVDKTSDVYFVGQLYGYGVAMAAGSGTVSTASTHGTTYTSGQPVYQGSTVTIQAGTVTTIQNATSVASNNIPVNVPNTVLGGFVTNFTGEPVTVSGLKININSTGTTSASEITGVTIVASNGTVIAGPVDAVGSVVNFTNSITFPVGSMTYTVKGKIPSTGWPNNATAQLNTTPSSWTSPTGQTTGNSITISTANFTMNTMTVRAGALALTAGTTPASQNIVAGGSNVLFANIQLDASQSGEDVRLSSLSGLNLTLGGSAAASSLSGCQLWNGSTAVNTGTNVPNPVASGANTFTFDNAITIPKGTVVTLGLQCNVSSSAVANNTFTWGLTTVSSTSTGTGVQSGNSITPTATIGNSGVMTVTSGASVTVNIDASSPSYTVQSAGTTGVTMGVIKIRSANEGFNLTKLGLKLNNGTYGSSATGAGGSSTGPNDLVTVYLYNGPTLLGTAVFTGSNTTATSTFSTPFAVARDTDTQITVKADLAQIGVSAAGGIGDLIMVDPVNFEGTGVLSGTTVRGGATAGVAGVRIFKSYPTLSLDTLPSTGIADGRLIHFKVTANASGPVGISQFVFSLATTTATVTNVQLYGFTDSGYSQPITSGAGTGGQIGTTSPASGLAIAPVLTFNPSVSSAVEVPAGQTYYFELRGSVSGVSTGASVVTTLKGDAAFPANQAAGYNVTTSAAASSTKNFVWAGNSTTTSSYVTDVDWSDGYSIPGLPSSGLIQTRSN